MCVKVPIIFLACTQKNTIIQTGWFTAKHFAYDLKFIQKIYNNRDDCSIRTFDYKYMFY